MSHHQRAVGAAILLNTALSGGEAIAGYAANSLSLLTDSVHNLSDELALIALWAAFFVSRGPSRALLRSANIFNSVGLMAVSGVLLWQAFERFLHPVPVQGIVPILAGLGAAVANWGVARLLLPASERNAAIRLAYIHNLGDVWVSLAPVLAGALLIATGYWIFDPIVAAMVAIWFIVSTGREVIASSDELIWPERIICCHTETDPCASVLPVSG